MPPARKKKELSEKSRKLRTSFTAILEEMEILGTISSTRKDKSVPLPKRFPERRKRSSALPTSGEYENARF